MSLYDWSIDHHPQSDDHIVSLRHHMLESDILEQNLKQSFRTPEDFPNYDTFSYMKKKWDSDLGLLCPERNRCLSGKAPAQISLQNFKLECSVCGKLFDSARALRRHILSHSQQREHVCSICKKSFKRQDHLTGHMLTHLKSKPFVCMELGCNKRYCDPRSLKRHLDVHHGQYTVNDASATNATCKELQRKEQPMSFHLLPSISKVETIPSQPSFSDMDLLWQQLNENSEEELVSNVVIQDPSEGPAHLAVALSKNKMAADYTCASLNSVPSNTYTLLNTTSKVSEDPETHLYPGLGSDCLGLWSDKAPKTMNPKQSIVYSPAGSLECFVQNNLNGQPVQVNLNKPVEKYVSSVSTSVTLGDQSENTLDTLPPIQQSSTNVTLPTYESLCSQLETHQQLFNTLVDFQPLFSQDQTQSHPTLTTYCCLPDMITGSVTPQRDIKCEQVDGMGDTPMSCIQIAEHPILSEIHVTDSSPYYVPFTSIGKEMEQQLADGLLSNALTCSSPLMSSKSKTDQKRGGHHQNSSLSKELTFPVDDTVSLSQFAMESNSFSSKSSDEKTNSGIAIFKRFQAENIHKLLSEERGSTDIAHRLSSAFDKMELAEYGACLPSSSVDKTNPSVGRRARDQKHPLQDVHKGVSKHCRKNRFPQAPEPSTGVMKDPGRLVMPVSVPVTVTDHPDNNKIVNEQEASVLRASSSLSAEAEEKETVSSISAAGGERCERPASLLPHRPASCHRSAEPCVGGDSPHGHSRLSSAEQVNEEEGHLQNRNTKKRKRPAPKPLYIPPPLLDVISSPTGRFQSNLRSSTTSLFEHYQNGIFEYPAYTPPPMLSPIRPGSGLYFNTFYSSSSAASPAFCFPKKETSPCETLLVKDSMVFTVQPHINIGNRFQAEIPEIQGSLSLGGDKADLVWKPLEMTKTVSNFLKLACSSAVPGGGSNLEFALHCLHLNRGNILDALDKLLIQEPQKYLPQCLADYHYAGSDHWSAAEKMLFKKAYRNNRKDFSYIQTMISQKNLYQCVEYYYTWKKRISFDKRGTSAAEQESTFDGRESESNKNNAVFGKKTNILRPEVKEMPPHDIQEDSRDTIKPLSQFPCRKCDRVFYKIQSRNAHMRKHCQEVKMAHSLKICEEESAAY